MSEQGTLDFNNFETTTINQFSEKAYLDYSMYVILDRALPHLADGLKPVQRRIIYAMSELGLKNSAKYKKSARTVGDVLGKFHPHGDSACYEAMVLMAQSFSYRYPLVDGQGNWGSPDDPKSFAAMRYTESRLAAYAETLLQEIEHGTVDWVANFDGTLDEPKILPAQLPNILLNGSTGIAVGMATDIPPHNLHEVVNACLHLLDNPKADVKELTGYLLAPDYPTEAEIITPLTDIAAMYETGLGAIHMRATYVCEQGEVIITALPHQVSGNKIIEQIAAQMQKKKLPMLVDLRDESCHENPTRLVLVPKSSRIAVDELMSHLFATTDLEKKYRVNLNMIGLDGRPQVKNLKTILSEWIEFRKATTTKRLQHRLDKILARLHLLTGLMIAYLNIDEVIAIIREEDKPKTVLMTRFKLTEQQADAILDLKLRHLAKLEETKIRSEQETLDEEREQLEKTLSSSARLKTLIRKECKAVADIYGDKRRSPLVSRSTAQVMAKTQQPAEAVTVVLSQKGWVRAGKGHEVDGLNLSYKSGDSFLMQTPGRSNQSAIFLDSSGRSYALAAHSLPSVRGQGEPLTGRLTPPSGAVFLAVLMAESHRHFILLSSQGYGFLCTTENMITKNRNGKRLVNLAEGAILLPPLALDTLDKHYLALVSQQGLMTVLPLPDCPELDKGKGARLLNIATKAFKVGKDSLHSAVVLREKQNLVLRSGRKKATMTPRSWKQFLHEKGHKGDVLPKGLHKSVVLDAEEIAS